MEVDGVEIAVVSGNFPSSQTFIEVKIAETAMAIKDGATEVDIVMPVGKFSVKITKVSAMIFRNSRKLVVSIR